MHVRSARADDRPFIDESYVTIGFAPCGPDDEVVVAEDDGERVGLGRLVPVGPGAVELGGIFVVPGRRRHGIAAAVVRDLLERSRGQRVYCVPFANLAEYYKGFGFVDCAFDDSVPAALHDKRAFCSRYPQGVVLLVMP